MRGRATLAALACGVLAGLTSGIWLASAVGASSVDRTSLPDVAAAPPEDTESPQASEDSQAAEAPGASETPEAEEPPAKLAITEAPLGLSGRLPVSRAALALPAAPSGASADGPERLFEMVDSPGDGGPLRIEYSLDAELTRHVFQVLEDGHVALGHVIVLDPATGRVLAYASTDTQRFPATRTYPAASLVKVITAAAALGADPYAARLPCRYSGSPYRLTPARIDPPRRSGNVVSLRQALATSNNQCLAQLAVHSVGVEMLLETISRFGWTHEPAPAHAAGIVDDPEGDRFGVGKLGCGLAGCRITPLHAAQLAGALAFGEVVEPRWIDRIVDASGRELALPAGAPPAPGALARAGRRAAATCWSTPPRAAPRGAHFAPAAAGRCSGPCRSRARRAASRAPIPGPLRVVHRRGAGRRAAHRRRGGRGAARAAGGAMPRRWRARCCAASSATVACVEPTRSNV